MVCLARAYDLETLSQGIKTPSNLFDLMVNVQFLLRSGMLLDRNLYETRRLLAFLGGRDVFWLNRNVGNEQAMVNGFAALIEELDINGSPLDGIDCRLGRHLDASGQQAAQLNLLFRKSEPVLSFNAAVGIFGANWAVAPGAFIPSGKIIDPPTDPNGNAQIQYLLQSEAFQCFVELEFWSDGNLQQLTGTVS